MLDQDIKIDSGFELQGFKYQITRIRLQFSGADYNQFSLKAHDRTQSLKLLTPRFKHVNVTMEHSLTYQHLSIYTSTFSLSMQDFQLMANVSARKSDLYTVKIHLKQA